jgi:hypothetical protein
MPLVPAVPLVELEPPPGLGFVETALPEHPGRISPQITVPDANLTNNCFVRLFTSHSAFRSLRCFG